MAVQITYSKEQILNLLEENKEKIKEFGVARLGLFGSYARDEQTPESDMDVLVDFIEGKKNYQNLLNLADFLEDLFKNKTDVVTSQAIANWMKPYIDKEIIYVEFNH